MPPQRTARPLRDADVTTQRATPNNPLTVRTDVRAGIHGSDFNTGHR
ncbi:MAG: hypothetical protein U0324_17305 [Polyangiales bacterium]